MKRELPFESAFLMPVFDAGRDGITPQVSSGVTYGGEECLTTRPGFSPTFPAISARLLSVSGEDSLCIITGQPFSLAISIPLASTSLDASHMSLSQPKCGLPISPMAAAFPSATAFPAASIPSMSIPLALSSPNASASGTIRTGYGPTATLTSTDVDSLAFAARSYVIS